MTHKCICLCVCVCAIQKFNPTPYLFRLGGETSRQTGATFVTMNKGYFSDALQLESCLQKSLPELEVLDFTNASQTASVVNGDVEATTQGKIKDFLDPALLSRAKFILLNAIFFKGEWEYKFEPRDTAPRPFRMSPGREVGPIPMMTQTGEFNYGKLGASHAFYFI